MAGLYGKNNSNLKTKIFADPGEAIRGVLTGYYHAGIVKKYLNHTECERQAIGVEAHAKMRTSSVGGGTLGPSLFEHAKNPDDYFNESATAASLVNQAIGTTHPPSLLTAIKKFESLKYGYRVKPVTYNGMPAAYNRGLIFRSSSANIVKIHEDLSNLLALSKFSLVIADAGMVIAHNLYLRNQPGEGSLTMYGKRFTQQEKQAIDKKYSNLGKNKPDVEASGYYYPDQELNNVPTVTIDVETGDYVVFRADFSHKVHNNPKLSAYSAKNRVSWNGFFTILDFNNKELLYWT